MISGWRKKGIKFLIWLNILVLSIRKFRNPLLAIKRLKQLSALRDAYREKHKIIKYSVTDGRYYYTHNAPGWPSKAFNRYIYHHLGRFDEKRTTSFHTLLFGITKKCGFKCEHCFEWDNLNKTETLTKRDLTYVIDISHKLGLSQVQFSGGEPLNRFNDLVEILPMFKGIDFWLYTSGYHLSQQKAKQLKKAGFTGVLISLDHWDPLKHDAFRGKEGSFNWVIKAANNIFENKMVCCLSLCATNEFISEENLYRYAALARKLKVSFIQILEPQAVGHYAGKNVALTTGNQLLLESFYKKMNFDPSFINFPSVIYHGFYSRRIGCAGAGKDYLYVDTDGFAHDCPFCQKKNFNVLQGNVEAMVKTMQNSGCKVYSSCK